MTLHGKTEGRVGVDWGNSYHREARFFKIVSWLEISDGLPTFIMDTSGLTIHKIL